MTLQGLTVALSESGIDAFAKDLVADQIAGQLAKLTPPNNSFPVKDFGVPDGDGSDNYEDIKITLSGGSLSGFDPVYQSISQGSDGAFSLTMKASDFKVEYNWNEKYKEYICTTICFPAESHDKNYHYEVSFDSLVITVGLQLSYSSGTWDLKVSGVTSQPSAPKASIPHDSILNNQEVSGCFQTRISKQTKNAVSTIDFQTPIKALVGNLGVQIPSTGKLTQDITFDFGTGPSGLSFPGDQGVQVGVTGQVTYENTPYSGGTPPQLPLPAVPTSKHLAYYAAAYEFDALFWAFYKQGLLKELITPGDLPDPSPLYTNTYKNTPLQGLYTQYPNHTMTAYVAAAAAPTTAFQTVYDLSTAVLGKLKSTLPGDVFDKLQGLANQYYLSEASFFTSLVAALGKNDANQWKSTIENAAEGAGTVVSHENRVTINVLQNGKSLPAFSFSVVQQDVLSNLALGISKSGTTQTLQFGFQVVPGTVTTKLIHSAIPSITTNNFGYIWSFVLEPEFANEVALMGKQGVALPRIPGFEFLFDKAEISIEATDGGYVAVQTDFEYKPSSNEAIGDLAADGRGRAA
ncbi:MAG: hypothetical protein AAF604_24215 [Acidobacteriota bacterium]